MAEELKKVQPGEVIKSDLLNRIIDRLVDLTDAVTALGFTTGTVTMPNLFGRTLGSAQSLISQPQINLRLGNTLDAHGTALDPDISDTKQRIVIGQGPAPGARVKSNTSVDVLLSAKPTTGTGTPPSTRPVISSFNPVKNPIGERVTIFGQNFDVDRTKNKVFFADTPTAEPPERAATTELLVRVPNIPDPPAAGAEKRVTVLVQTPNGEGLGETTLLPRLAGDPPELTSIRGSDPDVLIVGEIATITGKNFSTSIQENKITFGSTTTSPETTGNTATNLRVRVPNLPQLSTVNFVFVDIFITIGGRQSNSLRKEVDKP